VEAVENWQMCDLSVEAVKYIFVDGVNFHMRVRRSVELVPVLVAMGLRKGGQRLVLGLQAGDKENGTTYNKCTGSKQDK
jgi:putative transposase